MMEVSSLLSLPDGLEVASLAITDDALRIQVLEDTGVLDHFSAKKAVWLFVRPFDDLAKQEQEELMTMCQDSATAEIIYQLVQEFFRLIHSRQGTQLDSWLGKVKASAIQYQFAF